MVEAVQTHVHDMVFDPASWDGRAKGDEDVMLRSVTESLGFAGEYKNMAGSEDVGCVAPQVHMHRLSSPNNREHRPVGLSHRAGKDTLHMSMTISRKPRTQ